MNYYDFLFKIREHHSLSTTLCLSLFAAFELCVFKLGLVVSSSRVAITTQNQRPFCAYLKLLFQLILMIFPSYFFFFIMMLMNLLMLIRLSLKVVAASFVATQSCSLLSPPIIHCADGFSATDLQHCPWSGQMKPFLKQSLDWWLSLLSIL